MPELEAQCWHCSCSTGAKAKSTSGVTSIASAAVMMAAVSAPLSGIRDTLSRVQATHLIRQGLVLFAVGVLLALVLNLLQVQRNVTLFPEEAMAILFSSAWWVPLCCGTAAAVVGLLYPCIDRHLGEPHKFKREWASVMRCIAVFVGINHASAKLDFANNVQLSLTLAALSLGLWWTFDRSRSGFGLGITIAFLATLVTQVLVYNGVYQYTSPDFLYVRSWLPCIFFSGGVTVGNIGRQLAMTSAEKSHND
ncbi:insulin-induced gene 1 protein [Brienomyrus brachyistius]|uniref:insulin-induced gene 1 protein n=1 Tax=Brienomyrus brachyistius TaxID=42636 RepID=UPI0020B451D9|nr:insulin-induced gene 1 protein [Brienomyrus brachyistius]